VIDVCTGRGRDLGVRLPNLVAVGVRPDDPAARHGRLVCPSS